MTRHLCISVTFLDPLFHGRVDGGRLAEWPPSPLRLFQALLAGARAGCRDQSWSDVKARAFEWLERRDPPEIVAPKCRAARSYTLYVPNNDGDKVHDRQDRLTSKVARPHRLLKGDTVHYLWSIGDYEWSQAETRAAVDVLCQESRHLLSVGWGIDMAVGNARVLSATHLAEALSAAPERWQAHRGTGSRIPMEGTLVDLDRAYGEFVNTVRSDGTILNPTPVRRFRAVTYRRLGSLPDRPFAAFGLWRVDDLERRRAFRQEDAIVVAAMLRHAACEAAKRDSHQFPGGSDVYVAGHVNSSEQTPPRFSYLPLPTIGHPHADGMIRRVIVAEPHGGDGRHREWVELRLRGCELVGQNGGHPVAVLHRTPTDDKVVPQYVGPAKVWASVTPVILPGYDDFKAIADCRDTHPIKAERLLLKCLQQAGIPPESVADLTMRKAPFWAGSLHPRQYRRPEYLANPHAKPGWHVHLVFREPVPGPLAIGAGRHCGLGLFAGLDTGTPRS